MTELKDLLDRAGDDEGRPLLTDFDDLLARAQHGRARSRAGRIAGAVVAAGAAATLVVGVVALQSHGAREVAPTGTGPSTSPPPAERVPTISAAEALERCRPQLAAYRDLPMYTPHPDQADWSVRPGRYMVNQLLLADPGDGYNPEFCRVPAPGREDRPVPLASYTGTTRSLIYLTWNCQELAPYSGSSFRLDHPRSGGITAADTVDEVSAAVLVTRDGQAALCSMSPVTWDAGITDVQRFDHGVALSYGTTGGSNKSIVQETASWYLVGGVLSREAATLELSVSGGPTKTFPVQDGYVAGVLRDPRPGGLMPVSWRVLDDQGNVLRSGHDG